MGGDALATTDEAERRRLLSEVSQLPYTLVFLEAPHRLLSSLEDLQQSLGDRQAAVTRPALHLGAASPQWPCERAAGG